MNPELLKIREYFCTRMATRENPINTPEVIAMVREMCLDQEEIDIRLEGEFTARGGYVYKEYKDNFPHVVKPFELAEGVLINSIDPHDSTPHGVCWLWVSDKMYTVAELFIPGTIDELSDAILMTEMRLGQEPIVRLCDPSAWNEEQQANTKTTAQLFEANGLYVEKGSKDMTGGNRKVRVELQHERLAIFENLKRLRFEMRNYRYPDQKRMRDERKRSDKPIDKDDHIIECQRRAVEYVVDGNIDMDIVHREMEFVTPDGRILDIKFEKEDQFDPLLQ